MFLNELGISVDLDLRGSIPGEFKAGPVIEGLDYFQLPVNRDEIALDSVAEENGAKQAAVYVSGAYPEMIFAIKAVDANAADQVMKAIEKILDNYEKNYTNYGPEQVSKITSAVKVVRGQYVFVIVSNDNAAAQTYLNGLLG